jgi:hypothetical protein
MPEGDMLSASEVEAASVPDAERAGMHVAESAAELNAEEEESAEAGLEEDEPEMAIGLESEPDAAEFDDAGED